jgi:guanidinobutyrase
MRDPYVTPGTFMGVPSGGDLRNARAAILGVPFDCGFHPTRVGARLGPQAVREASVHVRPYEPPHFDFNPLTELGVVDCGDVRLTSSRVEEAYENIEEAVWRIADREVIPVTIGGDGGVTLPQLRALHRKYPDLAVLHLDAHTDTYPDNGVHRFTNATTFTRAAEEGVVDVKHSIHIGARGPVSVKNLFEFTRAFGYELIPDMEMRALGLPQVMERARERLGNRPVYLCFDMDFFDPSVAPGVATPTWGGINAQDAYAILERIQGLNLVGIDVNCVSPPHDPTGMTSFLAGLVMLKCLQAVCVSSNKPKVAR